MTDREKLIELFRQLDACICNLCDDRDNAFEHSAGLLADHLLANGVVVREWIPVTERLPEGNVLACFDDGEISSQVCTGCLKEDRWFLTVRRFGDVTHWMPLPEPPADNRKESKA